jgi:hypothetical protein
MPRSFPQFPVVDQAIQDVRSSFFRGNRSGVNRGSGPFTPAELEIASRFNAAEELARVRAKRAAMGADRNEPKTD